MTPSDALLACRALKLTVEQYYLIYLVFLRRQGFGTLSDMYLKLITYTANDVSVLIKQGYFTTFHADSTSIDHMVLTEKGEDMFMPTAMGEELWEKYPSVFPLSTGGFFVTKGGSKDYIIDVYRKKIDGNPAKHQEVIKQLGRYIKMVENGHINGNKIIDFVGGELWDAIAALPDNMVSNFKDDI